MSRITEQTNEDQAVELTTALRDDNHNVVNFSRPFLFADFFSFLVLCFNYKNRRNFARSLSFSHFSLICLRSHVVVLSLSLKTCCLKRQHGLSVFVTWCGERMVQTLPSPSHIPHPTTTIAHEKWSCCLVSNIG